MTKKQSIKIMFLFPVLILLAYYSIFYIFAGDNEELLLKIGDPYIYVNATEKFEIDPGRNTFPILLNNSTFVPMRSIIEQIGGTVSWNNTTKTAEFIKDGTSIKMGTSKVVPKKYPLYLNTQNSSKVLDVFEVQNNIYIDNIPHPTEKKPIIINGRIYFPLRFISEKLNCEVNWNSIDKSILINYTKIDSNLNYFYPVETFETLTNPYIGWAPIADGEPYYQPHTLVFIKVSWKDLEPEKGIIDFAKLESNNKFSYWKNKGVKAILRIYSDYPGVNKHYDIPAWLYKEINGDGSYYTIDSELFGFSPNYNNQVFIENHKNLIEKLAQRYNNDSFISFIQLGSLGHWGEWHTEYANTSSKSKYFPAEDVANQYVQHYINYFPNKKLLMRYPRTIAKTKNLGLYNDMFGNKEYTDDYINSIKNGTDDYILKENYPAMPDFWKTSASGGEIGNYPGLLYFEDKNINETLKQINDCHVSWLGPSCPAKVPKDSNLQKNLDQAINLMGYRYVITKSQFPEIMKSGAKNNIQLTIENKGCAPFYFDWPIEISLSEKDGSLKYTEIVNTDIKEWLPGKNLSEILLNLPENISSGNYIMKIAILNPETNKPAVKFAINGKDNNLRYNIGSVIVEK